MTTRRMPTAPLPEGPAPAGAGPDPARGAEQLSAVLLALLEATPDLVCFKDLRRRYVVSNPTHSSWLGVPHGALIGKTVFEVLGSDSALAADTDESDSRVLETRRPARRVGSWSCWPSSAR